MEAYERRFFNKIKYESATSPCGSNNIVGGVVNKSNEDAEGVWSPDIEMAFQEALEAYPPCGRRKIILTDEGKMYGRNELIARYIKEKTGKSRTRKQVSSHIQVLARKKSKELQQQIKDSEARDKLLQQYSSMSSAQIVNEVMKEKKLRADINGSSPVHHTPLYSSTTPFKHEIKSECGSSPPGVPVTLMNSSNSVSNTNPPHVIPNLQFIKSELDDGGRHGIHSHQKYRANNLIVTTADTINTYFTASNLQAMALPRTLSSMVDSSGFGVTAHQRTMHQSPDSTHNGNSASSLPQPRFKLLKFNGYMESVDKSWRHYFIDLNCTETEFSDPCLESIKIDNIHDKFKEFPSGNGVHEPTLKELFKTGPRSAFFVVKFWVNLNMPRRESNKSASTFHGHDNVWESRERLQIKVSTKACSFGKGVVEKVQKVEPRPHNGSYLYEVDKSPLCEYMINFIDKLKDLPATTLMNNVLENFTVMQHIIDVDTLETLLCIACMFEVSDSNHPNYSIYRLTD